MISHLLDTNTCVEVIRRRSPAIVARLRECEAGAVGISAVTLAELHYGAAKSDDAARNFLALTQFCAPLDVLSFDHRAAVLYGTLRAALERRGSPIGPLDTLIAAHALSLRAALVTSNEHEFRRVEGLRIENWSAAPRRRAT